MITKISARAGNKEKYTRCIELRKQGLSYSEIRKEVLVAKSTLNNWLTLAGLTITKEHLEIQLNKRLSNRPSSYIANEASRLIRKEKTQRAIDDFLRRFDLKELDNLLIGGCLLYQAEGSKDDCHFSNSDYRVILYFLKFLETYFSRNRNRDLSFDLYIHVNRQQDLNRILNFWSDKLIISKERIKVFWKQHTATVKHNVDYVGQMRVRALKGNTTCKQILALSDIILSA